QAAHENFAVALNHDLRHEVLRIAGPNRGNERTVETAVAVKAREFATFCSIDSVERAADHDSAVLLYLYGLHVRRVVFRKFQTRSERRVEAPAWICSGNASRRRIRAGG